MLRKEKNKVLVITMNIVIRRAEKADCKRLLELIQELADYEKAPQEVTVSLAHFEESGFGEKPVWWAFVAEIDGKVEGFALYYIRYSTWKGQCLYLEDFLVTEKLRGKGAGKLLFDRIIQEAKDGFQPKFSAMWEGELPLSPKTFVVVEKSVKFASFKELYQRYLFLKMIKKPYDEVLVEFLNRVLYLFIGLTISLFPLSYYLKNYSPQRYISLI
ncbi:MAG: GNAT family N-acetyltransferase, partial [Sediminibacterium sp.]